MLSFPVLYYENTLFFILVICTKSLIKKPGKNEEDMKKELLESMVKRNTLENRVAIQHERMWLAFRIAVTCEIKTI